MHLQKLFGARSPVRVFAISGLVTVATLLAIAFGMGLASLYVVAILIVVEISFSFDNAIINARVLGRLSTFWQRLFLTLGIVVAIFGMRVLFPIMIVSLTSHLSWRGVLDLALHDSSKYGEYLQTAHPLIAAFGGAFLLMLAFQFFFDDERDILWIKHLERRLQRLTHWIWAPLVTSAILGILALLPVNTHARQTILAGALGTLSYVAIQLLVRAMESMQQSRKRTGAEQYGMAAVLTFTYLEILDASFSFDGVISAFAITSDVLLIAVGLGVGAVWVRSLTVYMVRKKTLKELVYLEHGAHYTVFVLALVMLTSAVLSIPDIVPGLTGVGIIGASIVASVRVRRLQSRGDTIKLNK